MKKKASQFDMKAHYWPHFFWAFWVYFAIVRLGQKMHFLKSQILLIDFITLKTNCGKGSVYDKKNVTDQKVFVL